jgi:hypothetical protein
MDNSLDYQVLAKEFFETADYFFCSSIDSELRNDEELEKKYHYILEKGHKIFSK